jgi:hypothetical protein
MFKFSLNLWIFIKVYKFFVQLFFLFLRNFVMLCHLSSLCFKSRILLFFCFSNLFIRIRFFIRFYWLILLNWLCFFFLILFNGKLWLRFNWRHHLWLIFTKFFSYILHIIWMFWFKIIFFLNFLFCYFSLINNSYFLLFYSKLLYFLKLFIQILFMFFPLYIFEFFF